MGLSPDDDSRAGARAVLWSARGDRETGLDYRPICPYKTLATGGPP